MDDLRTACCLLTSTLSTSAASVIIHRVPSPHAKRTEGGQGGGGGLAASATSSTMNVHSRLSRSTSSNRIENVASDVVSGVQAPY